MKTKTALLLFVSSCLMTALAPAQQPTTPPTKRAVPAARINQPSGSTAPATPRPELLAAGTVAPDFTAKDLAGKTVKLSDYKDKVVVLDFWATWCGPCMRSLPHTQEVAKEYKDQGVVVFADCTADTRAAFEPWVKANQSKYPDITFACDPNDRGSDTADERASKKLYNVSGIPTQYVIGKDGKVVLALVGFKEGDARLEAVLARAGIKVDSAVAAKGEEQIRKDEEDAARAKAALPPAK